MRPASDAGVSRRDGTSRRSWWAFTVMAFVMWQGRLGLAARAGRPCHIATLQLTGKTRFQRVYWRGCQGALLNALIGGTLSTWLRNRRRTNLKYGLFLFRTILKHSLELRLTVDWRIL